MPTRNRGRQPASVPASLNQSAITNKQNQTVTQTEEDSDEGLFDMMEGALTKELKRQKTKIVP